MNKIAKYLNQHVVGNIFDSPSILENYATDRSIMRIMPQMVAIPESTTDVRKIVKFVNQLAIKGIKVPITVRGSGLDKTGADLGDGIVLSTEHLNKIHEIDDHSRLVRVQAGVTIGQLNSALALYGLTVPVFADPRETIGGLISNFITDPGAGKYNGIYYYVDCLEAVLSDGDTVQTSRFSKYFLERKKGATSLEGAIYRGVDNLISDNQDLINKISDSGTIDAAGYQMISQVVRDKTKSFDLLPLFYAAQGTLGVITEVVLRCEVYAPEMMHFVAAFESINAALTYIHSVNQLIPVTLKIYDARMFKKAVAHGKDPALFAPKFYNGYFVLVGFDDKRRKTRRKLHKCLKMLPNNAAAIMETPENTVDFQRLKSATISYLNDDVRGERVSITDDFYVPSDHLSSFLTDLRVLEKTYNMELPVFGSYSTSNYSIRPDFQLAIIQDRQRLLRFLSDLTSLIDEHGGSITGGAPEGRTKALVINSAYSAEELKLYKSIKHLFDPNNILNPGVKTGANLRATVIKHLRSETNKGIITE